MIKKYLFVLVALIGLCFVSSASAQQKRGVSTAEERKSAVQMVNFLESQPFAKEAKDYRASLLYFLAEVPDISVTLCTNVFGESKKFKGDYDAELTGQLAYSQAKFIIENPDKAKDDSAVYLAGVEGVLRTWESIKKEKPKAKFKLMDELLEKQKAGALADFVKSNAANCK